LTNRPAVRLTSVGTPPDRFGGLEIASLEEAQA